MDADKIIADAEVAACYLRALVDRGVPVSAAIPMTCSYVSSRQFIDRAGDKPKEPWQD